MSDEIDTGNNAKRKALAIILVVGYIALSAYTSYQAEKRRRIQRTKDFVLNIIGWSVCALIILIMEKLLLK